MKLSCLVSNHNYRNFVGEAVASALDQTKPFDEIIVVDDGSTDGSLKYLNQQFGSHSHVRLVSKQQAGQLSCFHSGTELTIGDVVFFLDADDRYRPEYVATAVDLFESQANVDFLTVAYRDFGQTRRPRRLHRGTRDRGVSVLATLFGNAWVGMPTSCLSMRSSLLREILPYPFESLWQTRADDVLVFGSSLLGAHKYHLEQPLVEYRLHGANHFARRRLSATQKMQYALRVNQLIAWYSRRMGYDKSTLAYLLHREFRTWERPSLREMCAYLRMLARARPPLAVWIEQFTAILWHTARERFPQPGSDPPQRTLHLPESTRETATERTRKSAA